MCEDKKVCTKCGIEKTINEFYFRKDTQKYRSECTECHLKQKKEYGKKNRDKKNGYMRQYKIDNPTKNKEWRDKNKEHVLSKLKEWKSKNPQKDKTNKRNSYKRKLKTNPIFRLQENIRRLINLSFQKRNLKKGCRTFDILGIDMDGFKKYFESKFADGMGWENKGKWEIDHIIPISTAITEEDVLRLNHYTNLQPLWREDNLKKSNKLNHGIIISSLHS